MSTDRKSLSEESLLPMIFRNFRKFFWDVRRGGSVVVTRSKEGRLRVVRVTSGTHFVARGEVAKTAQAESEKACKPLCCNGLREFDGWLSVATPEIAGEFVQLICWVRRRK